MKRKSGINKIKDVIKSNKELRLGLILLSILILIAVFAPLLAPYDPYVLQDDLKVPPFTDGYILGTDGLGRDVLSMIIYGTRTSLIIGLIAALISAVIGTLIGAFAGFYGGIFDKIATEFMNIFIMTPTFFLILLIVAFFGSSIINIMIVIGLTSWTGNARLMRAQAITLRERTFVKSSEVIGERKSTIIFKHIIPNGIFPIVANTTMNISGAILTEASLSFLGLGDPNVVSWGQIINHGKNLLPNSWWISTFAGLAVVFTVLTFFLIGDGLNKVISPKLRDVEEGA